MNKPIVLLDADGVIFDYDHAFLRTYKKVTGVALDKSVITKYNLMSCVPLKKSFVKRLKTQLNKPGWAAKIKPYPEAIIAVKKLMKIANVYFVTANTRSNKTWTYDREKALQKFFGDKVKLVHTHHKYLVHGDFFIDDKLENVAEWQKWHPKGLAIVWHKAYNTAYQGIRADNWNDIIKMVKSSIW